MLKRAGVTAGAQINGFLCGEQRPSACKRLLGDDPIVVCMSADPEPQDSIGSIEAQSPIAGANAHGAEAADAFEVKGRVPGIGLE